MEGLRDALARCLLLALPPYAAVHLAGRASSAERPASALDAILEAAGLDPAYPGAQHPDSGALLFLLAPLDILAYLAMAASAFLLWRTPRAPTGAPAVLPTNARFGLHVRIFWSKVLDPRPARRAQKRPSLPKPCLFTQQSPGGAARGAAPGPGLAKACIALPCPPRA